MWVKNEKKIKHLIIWSFKLTPTNENKKNLPAIASERNFHSRGLPRSPNNHPSSQTAKFAKWSSRIFFSRSKEFLVFGFSEGKIKWYNLCSWIRCFRKVEVPPWLVLMSCLQMEHCPLSGESLFCVHPYTRFQSAIFIVFIMRYLFITIDICWRWCRLFVDIVIWINIFIRWMSCSRFCGSCCLCISCSSIRCHYR